MRVHFVITNSAINFWPSTVDKVVVVKPHTLYIRPLKAINEMMIIEFGDMVKFVDNETTRKAGVAAKEGTCLGFTTPSVTNIEFIGKTETDYAISIELSDTKEIVWTTQDLVEFISHGEGQVIEIGNKRYAKG
jgi:hypothetical protein